MVIEVNHGDVDDGGSVVELGGQEAIALAYMLHDVLLSAGASGLLPHE